MFSFHFLKFVLDVMNSINFDGVESTLMATLDDEKYFRWIFKICFGRCE